MVISTVVRPVSAHGAFLRATKGNPLVAGVFECLMRGGFLDHTPTHRPGRPIVFGRRCKRVIAWQHGDMVSYYSRILDEFGSADWLRYLLKDSLACTIAAKYKLPSRAAAYKRFGHDLGGFPLPSKDRPFRFRTENPAPRWECYPKGGYCPAGHHAHAVPLLDTLADARELYEVRGADTHASAWWRRAGAGSDDSEEPAASDASPGGRGAGADRHARGALTKLMTGARGLCARYY